MNDCANAVKWMMDLVKRKLEETDKKEKKSLAVGDQSEEFVLLTPTALGFLTAGRMNIYSISSEDWQKNYSEQLWSMDLYGRRKIMDIVHGRHVLLYCRSCFLKFL